MVARKTRVGDVVLVSVDPRQNNGSDEAPALITNLEDGDEKLVNLKVFLDSEEILHLRDISLVNKRPKDLTTKYVAYTS